VAWALAGPAPPNRSAAQACLSPYTSNACHELRNAGIAFERAIPVIYKAWRCIGDRFRADVVVAREVILEIKSVAAILPAREAQLYTYLRMSGIRIGLSLNFNARRLTDGIRRYVV
jgi:GxxExxY protein